VNDGEKLLDVRGLTVRFPTSDGVVQAVSDVTFSLSRGETLGVVGESGSGKSVSNLAIMGL
jgi:ABC-type dipeptide/oligopeptide/nickel transport system ATPase component